MKIAAGWVLPNLVSRETFIMQYIEAIQVIKMHFIAFMLYILASFYIFLWILYTNNVI